MSKEEKYVYNINLAMLRNILHNIHFWNVGNNELRIIWILSNILQFYRYVFFKCECLEISRAGTLSTSDRHSTSMQAAVRQSCALIRKGQAVQRKWV